MAPSLILLLLPAGVCEKGLALLVQRCSSDRCVSPATVTASCLSSLLSSSIAVSPSIEPQFLPSALLSFALGLVLAPLPLPHPLCSSSQPGLTPASLSPWLFFHSCSVALEFFSHPAPTPNNLDHLQTYLCSKTEPLYSVQAPKMDLSKRFTLFPLFHHFISQEAFKLFKTKIFCVCILN